MEIADIPYPIISDIAKGRCVPFIGAGFSKNASLPSGLSMPDWSELAAHLAKHAGTAISTSPPLVAQRYQKKFGRVQLVEAIRDALHSDRARPGLAHRSFSRLPFETVYTTNFDLLLEHAYTDEGRPYRSLVGELQLPFHAGRTAPSIIKMHGDVRHEEHIVITQDDYDGFLTRYPVIATHLSAMLITRTPLFIGYSLSDPDFKSVRAVVKSRLGSFERMAYVVQFDVSSEDVEAELVNNVHIVSLSADGHDSRDAALAHFFDVILAQLDTRSGISLRTSRPDAFEAVDTDIVKRAAESLDDAAVIEATSRLCFVMMPFSSRFDEVYRNLITPVASSQGLSTVRADEMSGPGFIMEQIRAAIQQARLCIADVTGSNANVLYEIGLAHAMKKPLILLAERRSKLPFDVAHERVVFYDHPLSEFEDTLRKAISLALAGSLARALQLLELEMYSSAIAAAGVVLEQRLICLLEAKSKGAERSSIGKMLRTMKEQKLISSAKLSKLLKVADLRNRSVHARTDALPSRSDAEFVMASVGEFLESSATGDCA